MTFDIVKQTDPYSCFAASLAMVTGIDYELMNHEYSVTPYVVPYGDNEWDIYAGTDMASVFDWAEMLDDNGYEVKVSKTPPIDTPCIANLVTYESEWWQWAHAVVVDSDGTVVCPADIFVGLTLTDLLESCNVVVAGYVTVRER